MLKSPARKASPTARPPRISGVALTKVSDSGPRMPDRVPFEAVAGSKTAPSNSATYPLATARPAAVNVSQG
jgi:hypothetical protein